MDVDLESVEIVFAQKLACGEPGTRRRALNALHDWIKEQSATQRKILSSNNYYFLQLIIFDG